MRTEELQNNSKQSSFSEQEYNELFLKAFKLTNSPDQFQYKTKARKEGITLTWSSVLTGDQLTVSDDGYITLLVKSSKPVGRHGCFTCVLLYSYR